MFFKEKYTDSARLLAPPIQQYPRQHLNFRPPEKPQGPPSWWDGERCGECGGGGGIAGSNVLHQYWKNISHDDDPIRVQLVAEDIIVGSEVRRSERCEVNGRILGSLQMHRLAGHMKIAADQLIDSA